MNEIPKITGAIPRTQSQQFLPSNYREIVEKINNGLRVCVILRGLPGSGKSYLGKKLIDDTIGQNATEHIISADDYFLKNGRYEYDRSKLPEAHQNAQRLFFNRASKGYSPLIVDNTNMQCWEMFPYIQAAVQYSYHLEILEPSTPWKWSAGKLAQKNKHNVTMEKIKIMMDNYDKITHVEDIVKNLLNLNIVKEPKIRDIPPFRPKDVALNDPDLSSFSLLDVNRNPQNEPLSWQKFNSDFQKQNVPSTSNYFSWDTQKKNQEQSSLNNWNPPPQIFEDKWDQPNEKEITIKEKDSNESKQEENKPQPQRKQRKNKKPSSPPNETAAIKPHRKNCPNESPSFTQLRELYPNINDRSLWDFFEKCQFDAEWCADMLCDENLPEQMDFGEDLTCNCFNSNNNNNNDYADNEATRKIRDMPSTSGINNNNGNNKKQTPVKAKKAKSNADELLAAKMAIEENVRIGEQFYPEHVNRVKGWKKISQSNAQTDFESVLMEQNPFTEDQKDDTLVALTVDDNMIKELDELFGEGQSYMKEILEQPNLFSKTKMFIKSSTAKQLYREILETFHGYKEEAKLKEIENDRYIAMMLHEQEKATKYPHLTQESNGDFKHIMETQAALKEYENEHDWQKIEKTETIAEKLSKEKIYRAFPNVDSTILDEIFEAQNKNFKRTIHIVLDSLGYTKDERKQVFKDIESTEKFTKKETIEEEEDFGPEEYACIKKVEELQEEIDRHSEEIMRCIQKSKDHIAKKEFNTASYYTSVVNLHKQLHEEKRQHLVNLKAFSFLNNASSSRLDLHYFTQEEGKARLHTFLDAHIAKLREIKKQFVELEIVTGRGAHSSLGKPVIKTMTIKLFQERGLRHSEVNPGLLKVKVFTNSMLYEEKQRMMKSES